MPDPDPHSLSALVGPSVAGDPAARGRLLELLRPYLHALVRRQLGPEPPPGLDPSSVVQKSLLRVHERLDQLREPDVPHLLRWAGRIVHNLIVDDLRAAARRPRPVPGSALATHPAGPEPDPVERDEDAVRVAAAMEHLPARYRAVLELTFCDALPDAELAARLVASAGAVRVLRFRALARLRELLDDGGDR